MKKNFRGHLSDLLHPVEGGSGLEPGDLLLVEGVVQGDVHALAVGGHGGGHGLHEINEGF